MACAVCLERNVGTYKAEDSLFAQPDVDLWSGVSYVQVPANAAASSGSTDLPGSGSENNTTSITNVGTGAAPASITESNQAKPTPVSSNDLDAMVPADGSKGSPHPVDSAAKPKDANHTQQRQCKVFPKIFLCPFANALCAIAALFCLAWDGSHPCDHLTNSQIVC